MHSTGLDSSLWTEFPIRHLVCLITTSPLGSLSCCSNLSVSSGSALLASWRWQGPGPWLSTLLHPASHPLGRQPVWQHTWISWWRKSTNLTFFAIFLLEVCDTHTSPTQCTKSRWINHIYQPEMQIVSLNENFATWVPSGLVWGTVSFNISKHGLGSRTRYILKMAGVQIKPGIYWQK